MVPTFKPIRFANSNAENAQFFATVRKRVDTYFKENNISKHYNSAMVVKTVVLLGAYALPFTAILLLKPNFAGSLALWAIMGFALAGIGMSVMHDANHGAYSSNSKVNKWLGHSLNLLGGSVSNWKIQHNVLHHTYTNIVTHDMDIQDKVILRFSPHTQVKWYHRLQIIYAVFFYGITTLYWALLKDFLQFQTFKKIGINRDNKVQNRTFLLKLLADKIIYLLLFIGLPIFVMRIPAYQVIIGFFFMHFIAGIVLTLIFQLAHTVEGTSHPLADENDSIENNWAIHQMHTTVNFSRKNKFISWYVGGLNFQIEHHLFPTICHVHYPQISEIVKQTAFEFNVPYLENKSFAEAIASHFKTLIRFGKLPRLNEAIV